MKLFLLNIGEVYPEHISPLTPERAEQAKRYRFFDDQKRCIAGGILLRRFLGGRDIYTDSFGKPRADGICFNLSHSSDWALLAVDEQEVGCDIERHKIINPLRLGSVVFTEKELEVIRSSQERLASFYDIWTKKEALLKCMGKGFHRSAKSVDVSADCFTEGEKTYFIRSQTFSDYTVSACSAGSDFDLEMKIVHI